MFLVGVPAKMDGASRCQMLPTSSGRAETWMFRLGGRDGTRSTGFTAVWPDVRAKQTAGKDEMSLRKCWRMWRYSLNLAVSWISY